MSVRETRPEIHDPMECQGPVIKISCLFYINCAIFFMSAVFIVLEFWRLLANKSISYNIEDFFQPA